MNFIGSFVCCNDDDDLHYNDDEGEILFLQELGFGNNNSRLGSEDSLHWNIDRSKVYSLHSGSSHNNSSHSNNNSSHNNNNNNNNNSSSSGDIINGMSNMFSFNPLQNIAQNPLKVGDDKDEGSNSIMKQSTDMMVAALNTPLNAPLLNTVHQAISQEEEGLLLPVLMDDEEKALIERAIAEEEEGEAFDGSVSSSVHGLEMYDDDHHLLSVDQFWNAVSYNPLSGDCDGDGGSGGDELSILQEIEGMIASVTDPVGKVGSLLLLI